MLDSVNINIKVVMKKKIIFFLLVLLFLPWIVSACHSSETTTVVKHPITPEKKSYVVTDGVRVDN